MSLDITNLCVIADDGRQVVNDVSLSVASGQVTAILGANGAGKSELVLGVAGLLKINQGSVIVDSVDITGKPPGVVRAAKVAAVPEGHRVLTQLSVEENLAAAGALLDSSIVPTLNSVYDYFPELSERKNQLAGTLSGDQQQVLALGHSLMCNPKYLLIDEMSLGLAPVIVKRLMNVVDELKNNGVGIILIEQFTELALKLADDALILRSGTVRFSGPSQTLRDNAELVDNAYFGIES